MTTITMRNFMNAMLTGELVINYKDENDKVAQKSIPILNEDGSLIDEIKSYATEQLEKLDKKNSGKKEDGKPSAKQIENEGYKNQILSLMEDDMAYSSKEIVAFGIMGVTSPQKVSVLMRGLVADGKVSVKDGKTKLYTKLTRAGTVSENENGAMPF